MGKTQDDVLCLSVIALHLVDAFAQDFRSPLEGHLRLAKHLETFVEKSDQFQVVIYCSRSRSQSSTGNFAAVAVGVSISTVAR